MLTGQSTLSRNLSRTLSLRISLYLFANVAMNPTTLLSLVVVSMLMSTAAVVAMSVDADDLDIRATRGGESRHSARHVSRVQADGHQEEEDIGSDLQQQQQRRLDRVETMAGKRGFRNGAGDRFSHGFGKRLQWHLNCVIV